MASSDGESKRNAGSPRVLVAPDSFKGTMTAGEVAAAIAAGVSDAGAVAIELPVADGGEGTLDVLLQPLGAELVSVPAHDARGRRIAAEIGLAADGETAVVETARAIGLAAIPEAERDPWTATSHGAGELIAAAAAAGARRILTGVGGSATVDGGAGAIEAIHRAGGIGSARIIVLCDVTTPWERCAEVYGPQKGASPEMVVRLAARLDELAATLPRDPRGVPRTGAAGGLSGGLWAAFGAELVSGADRVLEELRFDERLAAADALVIGEGSIDEQSLEGKITGTLAARARARGIPVYAMVGRDGLGARAAELGLAGVVEAGDPDALRSAGAELADRLAAAAGNL